MKSSVLVYDLIHAMSHDEVNNFYRYAKVKGDARKKKYLHLFRLLLGQNDYDELAIREELLTPQTGRLSAAKNYLTGLILRSLVYYARDPRTEVAHLISENEVLIRKRQWKLALKRIRKGLKRALAEERFDAGVRLLDQQKRVFLATERFREWKTLAAELREQRKQLRQAQHVLEQMQDLYDHYYPLIKSNFTPRGALDLQLIEALEGEPFMSPDIRLGSRRAELYRLRLRYFVALFRRDFATSLSHEAAIVAHFEASPYLIEERYEEYVKRLLGLGVLRLHQGDPAAGRAMFEKLDRLRPKLVSDKARVFRARWQGWMTYAEQTGDDSVLDGQLETVSTGLKHYLPHFSIGEAYSFHWQMAKWLYRTGDPTGALRALRAIEAQPSAHVRADIQGMARVLTLVAGYEARDFELVRHKVRTYRSYFSKRSTLHAFEQRIFRFFNHPRIGDEGFRLREKLQELEADLEQIFTDPYERNVLNMFDVLAWVREKRMELESQLR